MPSLRAVLEAITETNGVYQTVAPEGWGQGRTLYGGMTAAFAAQVAMRMAPDLPPLRSAQFSFVGPAAGNLTFRPEILRQGRSATVVGVDCIADDKMAARAILTYGAARQSVIHHDVQRTVPAGPPEAWTAFAPSSGNGPEFFQHFDMRLVAGARPLAGASASPEFTVWIRHCDDQGVDPMVAFLALADGLPPAAMVQFPKPAAISTMTWMIDIAHPPALGCWYLGRSVSEAAAEGYSQQAMDVFDADGNRVAVSRQVVAIFI